MMGDVTATTSAGFIRPTRLSTTAPERAASAPTVAATDAAHIQTDGPAQAQALLRGMVKGEPAAVRSLLPFLATTLYSGFGLGELQKLQAYGVTFQLAPQVPTEGAPGWDLLGAYDPRAHVVHLSPNILASHGNTRAAQIVLHETTHAVDDCRQHASLEGPALAAQRTREASARDNAVFYQSEQNPVVAALQARYETRVNLGAMAVTMRTAGSDGQVTTDASDRASHYSLRTLADGRCELVQTSNDAPSAKLLKMRGRLHSMAVALGNLPGAAALAHRTEAFETEHETLHLGAGRTVEFTHSRYDTRMVFPADFSVHDWSAIRFSKYAFNAGVPREYLAESACHYLSDAESRRNFENVDPGMARFLSQQFPDTWQAAPATDAWQIAAGGNPVDAQAWQFATPPSTRLQ